MKRRRFVLSLFLCFLTAGMQGVGSANSQFDSRSILPPPAEDEIFPCPYPVSLPYQPAAVGLNATGPNECFPFCNALNVAAPAAGDSATMQAADTAVSSLTAVAMTMTRDLSNLIKQVINDSQVPDAINAANDGLGLTRPAHAPEMVYGCVPPESPQVASSMCGLILDRLDAEALAPAQTPCTSTADHCLDEADLAAQAKVAASLQFHPRISGALLPYGLASLDPSLIADIGLMIDDLYGDNLGVDVPAVKNREIEATDSTQASPESEYNPQNDAANYWSGDCNDYVDGDWEALYPQHADQSYGQTQASPGISLDALESMTVSPALSAAAQVIQGVANSLESVADSLASFADEIQADAPEAESASRVHDAEPYIGL